MSLSFCNKVSFCITDCNPFIPKILSPDLEIMINLYPDPA